MIEVWFKRFYVLRLISFLILQICKAKSTSISTTICNQLLLYKLSCLLSKTRYRKSTDNRRVFNHQGRGTGRWIGDIQTVWTLPRGRRLRMIDSIAILPRGSRLRLGVLVFILQFWKNDFPILHQSLISVAFWFPMRHEIIIIALFSWSIDNAWCQRAKIQPFCSSFNWVLVWNMVH